MSFITGSDCTSIVVNDIPVLALCGPIIRGGDDYEGGVKTSRKIIADEGNLPVIVGQSVDIDGEEWEVSESVVVFGVASVTFIRLSD